MIPRNQRDWRHLEWTDSMLKKFNCASLLDIGCYDGWLGACLGGNLDYLGVDKRQDGDWMDYDMQGKMYDACAMYEVLEHVSLDVVADFVDKAVVHTSKLILISLPDQKHEDNPEHLWTPNKKTIEMFWPQARVHYETYPGLPIPGNWFIYFFPAEYVSSIR